MGVRKGACLVGGRVFAEADVAVDAERDVLDGQFGNCLVNGDNALRGRLDE